MTVPIWDYRSTVPGATWPAIPSQEAANLLALQFQFEQTQWLPSERLIELQFRQLDALLCHAYSTVPYYRERWRGLYDSGVPLTPEHFSRLPLLTRSELQAHFDALRSTSVPPGHGPVTEIRTSGSTGQPVRVLKTGFCQLMWLAIVLREHCWFKRNLGGKLASIRMGVTEGEADGWGPATDAVARTGRSATLPIRTDVDTQLQWLERQQPDYLLTYPSNLMELVRGSIARGIRLLRLREVRTMGEILTDDLRDWVQRAWGVPITDSYSSHEVGYIALQCPEHEYYHVQSEAVLVEILDEEGHACAPGEVGRVVVSDLHNFALPLVRYEIGDYAEVGPPCGCRRGLPVLTRIAGRTRNMLVLADGRRFWPPLGSRKFVDVVPVLQAQFVQKEYDLIEVRLVVADPLTGEQEDRLRQFILPGLPSGIRLTFRYCDRIPRGAGGKFEDFVSEVAAR